MHANEAAAEIVATAPLYADERAALARYRLQLVTSSRDRQFDAAYDALAAYFGTRGQLEAKADLARLIDRAQDPLVCDGVAVVRPLLMLTTSDSQPVAVAERYVAYDPLSRVLSGLDANLLVLPAHRGARIGPLLERLLIHAGRRLLAPSGALRCTSGLELSDLEPLSRRAAADEIDADARRRVLVWGRNGYALIPPDVFPLSLLGMAASGGGMALPVPMRAILRIGMSAQRQPAAHVEKALLRTLAQHLYAAHAWADAEAAQVEYARQLDCIAAAESDPVPLLPLPQRRTDAIPDFLCLA
ncbi:MAG: hypothetical protein JNJ46_29910 [Myxococcales bacterium]|nr:hypothetical protein [Myxococcales bacterium]